MEHKHCAQWEETLTQQSCPDASPCTSPSAESAGSRRFRQPPAWGTWVLGIIFLLDVPVVLLLAFFMWWAVTDNAPDIPPGCSFMDPCPSTPGEYTRSLIFCLGSILLWVVFAYSIYRLLLACFDARESADSRRTTIAVTSALLVGLSAVVLCVLPDWAYGRSLFPQPFWNTARIYSYAYFFAAFLSMLYPAYFAVRARYFAYADARASAAIGETDS
ncbi:hypothetical protein CQR50_0092 [Bifidobacterium pseudolongum subsp. globosum]|uniref:Uncharacterized protein n=1 Tax=Bifidobacterium pseudolongum subsp. globosum TaxID=1690 RepID=A0A2N3R679_9BIFI|nr:hypothetical protein CQR50_0092 [Bifidobacterium pseudolongum subsp. globosum]